MKRTVLHFMTLAGIVALSGDALAQSSTYSYASPSLSEIQVYSSSGLSTYSGCPGSICPTGGGMATQATQARQATQAQQATQYRQPINRAPSLSTTTTTVSTPGIYSRPATTTTAPVATQGSRGPVISMPSSTLPAGVSSSPAIALPKTTLPAGVASTPGKPPSIAVNQPPVIVLPKDPAPAVTAPPTAPAVMTPPSAPATTTSTPEPVPVEEPTKVNVAPETKPEAEKTPEKTDTADKETSQPKSSGESDEQRAAREAEEAAARARREAHERAKHEAAKQARQQSAERAKANLGYEDIQPIEGVDGGLAIVTPPLDLGVVSALGAIIQGQQLAHVNKGKDSCAGAFAELCGAAAKKAAKDAQDALDKAKKEAKKEAEEEADKAKKKLKKKKKKLTDKKQKRQKKSKAAKERQRLKDKLKEQAEDLNEEGDKLKERGEKLEEEKQRIEDEAKDLREREQELRKQGDPNCRSAACQDIRKQREANSQERHKNVRDTGRFQADQARYQGQVQDFNRDRDRLQKMEDAGKGMTKAEFKAHQADKKSQAANQQARDIQSRIQDLKDKQLRLREQGGSNSKQDHALDKEIENLEKGLDKAKGFAEQARKDALGAKAEALGLGDDFKRYQKSRDVFTADHKAREKQIKLGELEAEERRLINEKASPEKLADIKSKIQAAEADYKKATAAAGKAMKELASISEGKTAPTPGKMLENVNGFVDRFNEAQQLDNMTDAELNDRIRMHEAAEKRIDQVTSGVGGEIPKPTGAVYDKLGDLQKNKQALEQKLTDLDKSMEARFNSGTPVHAHEGKAYAEARDKLVGDIARADGEIAKFDVLAEADGVTAKVFEVNKSLARLGAGLPTDKNGKVDAKVLAKQVAVVGNAQVGLSEMTGKLDYLAQKEASGQKLTAAEKSQQKKMTSQVRELTGQLEALGLDVDINGPKVNIEAETLGGAVTWNASREAVAGMVTKINKTREKVAKMKKQSGPVVKLTEPPKAKPSSTKQKVVAEKELKTRAREAGQGPPVVQVAAIETSPADELAGKINQTGGALASMAAKTGGAIAAGANKAGTTQTDVASLPPTGEKSKPAEPTKTKKKVTSDDIKRLRAEAEEAEKKKKAAEKAARDAERKAKAASEAAEKAKADAGSGRESDQREIKTRARQSSEYGKLAKGVEARLADADRRANALNDKAADLRKSAARYDQVAANAKSQALADKAREAAANARADAAKKEKAARKIISDSQRDRDAKQRYDERQADLKGESEKLKKKNAEADAKTAEKQAEAEAEEAEVANKKAEVEQAAREADAAKQKLQQAQAVHLGDVLRDPPSGDYWRKMSSGERTKWLADNVPGWDDMSTKEKTRVLETIDFSENRHQAVAAGNALDDFIKEKDFTPDGLRRRAQYIKALQSKLKEKKDELHLSEADQREIKSLTRELKLAKGRLAKDMKEFGKLRDDVVTKTKAAQKSLWTIDEKARAEESVRRMDSLVKAKGELKLAREAFAARDRAFKTRVSHIESLRDAALESGDKAKAEEHSLALKRLGEAQKQWQQKDAKDIKALESIVSTEREKIARDAFSDGLGPISDEKRLDQLANARLEETGVVRERLGRQNVIASQIVNSIDVKGKEFSVSGAIIDAYDRVKTDVAGKAGMLYGTGKGAVKGIVGLGKLVIWEPIDMVGEEAEMVMEMVTGSRTNLFGTDNQEFVDQVIDDPGEMGKKMFWGLAKEVHTFGKNLEKAGLAAQHNEAGMAFDANAGVGEFLGENILDPTMLLGGLGKFGKLAKVASEGADAAKMATKGLKTASLGDNVAATAAKGAKVDLPSTNVATLKGADPFAPTAASAGSEFVGKNTIMPKGKIGGMPKENIGMPSGKVGGMGEMAKAHPRGMPDGKVGGMIDGSILKAEGGKVVTDPRAFGMLPKVMRDFQQKVDAAGLSVRVRAANDAAISSLQAGHPPKHVKLKSKTINDLDVALGAKPGSQGQVGYFDPVLPPGAKKGDPVYKRFQQRRKEYLDNAADMKDLKKKGLVSVEDGVVIDRGLSNTRLGKDGKLKVDRSGPDGGTGKGFTGDHDMWDIRHPDGRPIVIDPKAPGFDPVAAQRKVELQAALDNGLAKTQHGPHKDWVPTTKRDIGIDQKIRQGHSPGGEALLEFSPNQPPRTSYEMGTQTAAKAVDGGTPTVKLSPSEAAGLKSETVKLPAPAGKSAVPDLFGASPGSARSPPPGNWDSAGTALNGGRGTPPPPPSSKAPFTPPPGDNAVDILRKQDGSMVVVRKADGKELVLGQDQLLGKGSFTEAYSVGKPGFDGMAVKVTSAAEGPAAALDDLGYAAVKGVEDTGAVSIPRVHKKYDVDFGAPDLAGDSFSGGRVTLVEKAPPSHKHAPEVVNLPDGTSYRVKMPDGTMTPGQAIAFNRGQRALNKKGFAWLDNKGDNFTFQRVGPPGTDQWKLVIVDPGGIVPMKATKAPDGTVRSAAQNARDLQKAHDAPDAKLLEPDPNMPERFQDQIIRERIHNQLGEKFDNAVDWDAVGKATDGKIKTLKYDPDTGVPYNPEMGQKYPKASALSKVGDEGLEAAEKALREAHSLE